MRAYSGLRANQGKLVLKAWLYRVAHNRCIDELRRPTPPPGLLEMVRPPLHDPIAAADQRESLRRLVADVRRLPEQQRSALLMRELGGMSYADVAAALGVTVPAVKSLLVRARIALAQASEARDTACSEIRGQLTLAHDRGVRPSGTARRHMRDCNGCRHFHRQVRGTSRQFAALAPTLGPLGLLAKVLGFGGSGGAAAGSAAAGGAAGTGALASAGVFAGGAGHVATLIAAAVVTAGGAVEIQQQVAASPAAHHRHHAKPAASAPPPAPQATPRAQTATFNPPPRRHRDGRRARPSDAVAAERDDRRQAVAPPRRQRPGPPAPGTPRPRIGVDAERPVGVRRCQQPEHHELVSGHQHEGHAAEPDRLRARVDIDLDLDRHRDQQFHGHGHGSAHCGHGRLHDQRFGDHRLPDAAADDGSQFHRHSFADRRPGDEQPVADADPHHRRLVSAGRIGSSPIDH